MMEKKNLEYYSVKYVENERGAQNSISTEITQEFYYHTADSRAGIKYY